MSRRFCATACVHHVVPFKELKKSSYHRVFRVALKIHIMQFTRKFWQSKPRSLLQALTTFGSLLGEEFFLSTQSSSVPRSQRGSLNITVA